MNALVDALHARLATDATLVALLGTYRTQPCIFSAIPIPSDAPRPYVAFDGHVTDVAFDTKTTLGRELSVDFVVVTDATGDTSLVNNIAERVRALVHRHKFVVVGFTTIVAVASGPVKSPTDNQLYGRTVPLTLKLRA